MMSWHVCRYQFWSYTTHIQHIIQEGDFRAHVYILWAQTGITFTKVALVTPRGPLSMYLLKSECHRLVQHYGIRVTVLTNSINSVADLFETKGFI